MSKIHPSAIISSRAQIDEDVEIGPFCVIGDNVKIGKGTKLHASVVIDGWTEIGENNEIFPGAIIGVEPQDLRYNGEVSYTKIGHRNVIREYVTIHRASDLHGTTYIGDDNLIMAYTHIAHNCTLGNQIIIANSVGLAGHVILEDQAVLGGMCGVHQFVRVGRLAMLGGMAKVCQDVPPFAMVDGQPARIYGMNIRGMQRKGITKEARMGLKTCYRLLLRSGLNLSQALSAMKRQVPPLEEVSHLIHFLESPSRMGVCIRERRTGSNSVPLKVTVEAAGG